MKNRLFRLVGLNLLALQISTMGQDPESRPFQRQSGSFEKKGSEGSEVIVNSDRRKDIWDRPHGRIIGKVEPTTHLKVVTIVQQGELTWYQVSGDMYTISRPRRPLDTGWISSLSVTVSGSISGPEDRRYKIVIYAYGPGTKVVRPDGAPYKSLSGHAFVGFYADGEVKIVQGFGPDGASLHFASKLSVENDLAKFASHSFTRSVTAEIFKKAILIEKKGYGLLLNDCVTYADDVADAIGLKTPSKIDFVITPIGFLEYLSKHNPS